MEICSWGKWSCIHCESGGIAVGALDMLIAAHALAENAVLVTNDGAIARLVGGPATVNWADDLWPN